MTTPASFAALANLRLRSHPRPKHLGQQGFSKRADAGTRTPDPFITSEVLYQLSYVGAAPDASEASAARGRSPAGAVGSPPSGAASLSSSASSDSPCF